MSVEVTRERIWKGSKRKGTGKAKSRRVAPFVSTGGVFVIQKPYRSSAKTTPPDLNSWVNCRSAA